MLQATHVPIILFVHALQPGTRLGSRMPCHHLSCWPGAALMQLWQRLPVSVTAVASSATQPSTHNRDT